MKASFRLCLNCIYSNILNECRLSVLSYITYDFQYLFCSFICNFMWNYYIQIKILQYIFHFFSDCFHRSNFLRCFLGYVQLIDGCVNFFGLIFSTYNLVYFIYNNLFLYILPFLK